MAAKCPTARASGYNSSKAAVTGFYNSLRQELVGSGVTVTGIYPGFINTGITSRAITASGDKTGKQMAIEANGMPGYDIYYTLGFAVLLVSSLLLIFLGWGILASPYVLTVASLIPLGISLGIANEYFSQWKKAYTWFALLGFIAIAVSAIADLETLKKISVQLFHGAAGLVIFLGPFFTKDAPKGFWWVGIGGALIGIGGIALAFLTGGSQLLFFSQEVVLQILAPLLLLMTLAFSKDIQAA